MLVEVGGEVLEEVALEGVHGPLEYDQAPLKIAFQTQIAEEMEKCSWAWLRPA